MERLPTLQYQLLGEFHTLLEYPSCSAISRSNLLQMMAINMFAIEHTASQGEWVYCCYLKLFWKATHHLVPEPCGGGI